MQRRAVPFSHENLSSAASRLDEGAVREFGALTIDPRVRSGKCGVWCKHDYVLERQPGGDKLGEKTSPWTKSPGSGRR